MILNLQDGRQLEVAVFGPQDGRALLFHGGTPSAAMMYPPAVDAAARRGLRTIVYSRPGYGESSPQPGRSIADCTRDVAAIVDALGVDAFLTVGWSGGGPHALACASLMRDRCEAAATIAGVAPFDAEGLVFLDGMGKENVEEFAAMVAGDPRLTEFLEAASNALATVTGPELAQGLGDIASEADRQALTGAFADFSATSLRAAVSAGIAGWHDDDLAFARDWGFSLGRGAPVTLWHGDQDRMVPQAHGKWLAAHIPNARVHFAAGEGHLSLFANRFDAILNDLLDLAGRGG